MPKVSVIIPIYGVERYIERCVRSLFEQSLDDIEFIFVDDCTTDNSIDILKRLIEEYRPHLVEKNSSVLVEKMPRNSGLPAVRKYGIQLCTGDYIIHCDSDDWVDNHMYEVLYKEASSNGYDIVSCDYYKSDGATHIKVCAKERPELWQGPLWNKLVHSSIYRDNKINYPKANKAEDGALMTQLSFFSKKKKHIDIPLYYYFYNENSICNAVSSEKCLERLTQELQNTELRIQFLEEQGVSDKYKMEIIIWKYITKSNLLPVLSQKKYYKLWKDTYPEISREILTSSYFSFKTKLNFILRYIRIKKS